MFAGTHAGFTGIFDLRVNPTATATKVVNEKFAKYFSNDIHSIALGQQGAYGMTVTIGAKVDLSRMNTKTLCFYRYDKATSSYQRIEQPAYFIDTADYLHFSTAMGGSGIITDSPLKRK